MKYKLTIETPDDVLTIQCNNIESVKRFADCVSGFISPAAEVDNVPWTPWNGGDCPVPKGTLIDVLYRDDEEKTVAALIDEFGNRDATPAHWSNDGMSSDIIAYRLHKSEEQKQ